MKLFTVRASLLALATALAACGGPGKTPTPADPPSNTGGDGTDPAAAEPFDKDAVRETLASMAIPEQCGSPDDAPSLGALFEQRSAELGAPADIDVTFSCQPVDEDWQCEWSAFTRPAAPDPEDPCAEMGSSGFQIITHVDASGALVPDTLGCVAPG